MAYFTATIADLVGAAAQMGSAVLLNPGTLVEKSIGTRSSGSDAILGATQLVLVGSVLLGILVRSPVLGADPTVADLADEDIWILVASRRVRVSTDSVVDRTHGAGHLERGLVISVSEER